MNRELDFPCFWHPATIFLLVVVFVFGFDNDESDMRIGIPSILSVSHRKEEWVFELTRSLEA